MAMSAIQTTGLARRGYVRIGHDGCRLEDSEPLIAPCGTNQHRHSDVGCQTDHPIPRCHLTDRVSYTVHGSNDTHVYAYIEPCGPPTTPPTTSGVTEQCVNGQHHHVGLGCHYDHIAPACDPVNLLRYATHDANGEHQWAYVVACTTTTRATTTTTQDPRCAAGQHYDSYTAACHRNHDPPTCSSRYENTYEVHDPSGHITAVVTQCGTNTPLPPSPPTCPAGQHYHSIPDACHQHDANPPCDPSRFVSYLAHLSNRNDHFWRVKYPCPVTTTTTTTTAPTTTAPTTTPPTTTTLIPTCGPIPPSALALIADQYGWDSTFDGPATVKVGTALPQAGGTSGLFITSDKMNSAGAAEPPIWPVFPTSASQVSDASGCLWDSMDVRSVWRELHIWNTADRLLMGRVVPSFVTRWNNLTSVQQDILRNGHTHSTPATQVCPMSTLDPKDDCDFYLPHPAVFAWQLQVRFETNSGGTTEESWETLYSGTSYLVRLIDYADYQWTVVH